MVITARTHERCRLSPERDAGLFLLKARQRQFRLDRVNNVSLSGACIQLPVALEVGTPVVFTYTEEDWHVTVRGHVAWSNRDRDSDGTLTTIAFRHGVRFDLENVDDNQSLFLVLRKFFDEEQWVRDHRVERTIAATATNKDTALDPI